MVSYIAWEKKPKAPCRHRELPDPESVAWGTIGWCGDCDRHVVRKTYDVAFGHMMTVWKPMWPLRRWLAHFLGRI